jgi:HEPN domain-containing protein
MNPSDEEIRKKVRKWVGFGDEDLKLARHALTLSSGCPYRLIAYHAQQCAEKYLKAYLVFHRLDFPYTHNISRLLELCAEKADWPGTILEAEELTAYAITTRYPGEDERVTKQEALRAIHISEKVRKIIRKVLRKDGLNY